MNDTDMLPVLPLHLQKQDIAFTFWCKGDPVGELDVTHFGADERISGLTSVHLTLASRNRAIDLNALLDTSATLTIHHKYLSELRHFSGIVVEAERLDSGRHHTGYQLTLLPVLYRLDIQSDCRIFQNMTVPQIAQAILDENHIQNVEWKLSDQHLAREYCVQYRETLLAFIQRIFAEEGIFFFLRHDPEGRHTIVVVDRPESLPDCKGQENLTYNAMASGAVKGVYCSNFSFREKLTATRFVQRDYTFKAPAANMQHSHTPPMLNGAKQDYTLYDYPGRYKEDIPGRSFARNRIEATRVDASLAHGIANTPLLMAGYGVTLTNHTTQELNRRWRLLSVEHSGGQPQALEEDAGSGAAWYSCAFTAQSSILPYRALQSIKPVVDGPQIARVVGPPGEEIYCDEHGRVKVLFPWDRYGKGDDTSSCWVRVSNGWGGAMYGHIAIPRIGHEVIVDFLEGDPDQPIITGRTYHATNRPPYELPRHKTRTLIKSQSHRKKEGSNELRFEDEGDQEEIWLHAEKYMNTVVESDETRRVGGNRHKLVEGSQSENVKGDKDISVEGSHAETISGAMNLKVDSIRQTQIVGQDHLIVNADQAEMIGGNWTRKVAENIRIESGEHMQLTCPGTLYLHASKIVLSADTQFSVKNGSQFVNMDDGGVQIEGATTNINSGSGSPAKGKDVPFTEPLEPRDYQGPYAERYKRSFDR